MQFDSLKEKCEYYRSLGERRLMPNGHIIMMLDGRAFSKLIKNKFEKPFDERFMNMMDETAKHLCRNISGVEFAYVQSDEISLYMHDDTMSGSFFGLRQTKLLSVPAAMAAGEFNRQALKEEMRSRIDGLDESGLDRLVCSASDVYGIIDGHKPAEFDCKVWNVPEWNDVIAWFLYRQLDCVRNSKQQTAQTWLSHKQLMGLESDQQVELLKAEKGIDWNGFDHKKKYGRLIRKVERMVAIPPEHVRNGVDKAVRTFWESFDMPILSEEGGREKLTRIVEGVE